MNTTENTAKILASITEEQWKVLLELIENGSKVVINGREEMEESNKAKTLEEIVADTIESIGIFPNVRGYEYLQEAVLLTLRDKTYVKNVTTRLYPAIAEKYGVSKTKVESAIRNAIKKSFNEANNGNHKKIFGEAYYSLKAKPTNSTAIAALNYYFKKINLNQ